VNGPYTHLAPTPKPGITVPGVGVPAPTQEDAVNTAVEYGWLIAVIIVGVVVIKAVRFVTRRIDVTLLLVLILLAAGAYQYGKAAG
jgi:hypothetical protein